MQKPEPRDEFVDNADEQDHIFDVLCWLTAEKMAPKLGLEQGECADALKRGVLEGIFLIEAHPDGEHCRILLPGQQLN
jgi:hypothetical protein